MSKAYQFAQIRTDTASLNALSLFLAKVFEQPDLFTYDYLHWQYAANPDGKVLGFTASQNAQLAAQYALQPFRAQIDGREVACLLSLNTATDLAHRGQGLFTQLAERSYALARALGYELIVGVANANSMPGFVNKLGFESLGPLEVRLGVGPLKSKKQPQPPHYHRLWDSASLAWRLQKPNNQYHWHAHQLRTPTAYPQISACLGHFAAPLPKQNPSSASLLQLYLGLDASIDFGWRYLKIPQKLRPSPLHFIYKVIGEQDFQLRRESTLFQALDFDAY
ncbi:MAG: GNAT family N-acetyltransferase [Bacteroidota bacterium]